MLTAGIVIASVLGYLGIGVVAGGHMAAEVDPDPGRASDDAKGWALIMGLFWPAVLPGWGMYRGALRYRQRVIAVQARKALPEARVVQ